MSVPWADVAAALENPSSLQADATAAEDIIGILPIPPVDALLAEIIIAGFTKLVIASGGGTITPDPLPMTDAQTTETLHTGRN